MSIDNVRELVAQLSASASALAVLGAELQLRATGKTLHPTLRPHANDVLRQIGALEALEGLSTAELAPLAAEIRHFWLLDNDFLSNPERVPGWTYTDDAVLGSGGEVTEGFPNALARFAPGLEGLVERITAPDAAFLDVGTGVGRLAIAMARRWPSLRVVGLDTWEPSLALARKNVADAGLQDRIELRRLAAEDLSERENFDLAWIPAPFVSTSLLPKLVNSVQKSLKPGGWLLFATAKPGADLRGAVLRFRVALYGGTPMTEDEIKKLLADEGLGDIQTLPGPPRDFKIVVAARRR